MCLTVQSLSDRTLVESQWKEAQLAKTTLCCTGLVFCWQGSLPVVEIGFDGGARVYVWLCTKELLFTPDPGFVHCRMSYMQPEGFSDGQWFGE